jgi:hypothetical protein
MLYGTVERLGTAGPVRRWFRFSGGKAGQVRQVRQVSRVQSSLRMPQPPHRKKTTACSHSSNLANDQKDKDQTDTEEQMKSKRVMRGRDNRNIAISPQTPLPLGTDGMGGKWDAASVKCPDQEEWRLSTAEMAGRKGPGQSRW